MKVLVDTSVWVAHFRQPDAALIGLLSRDSALSHPLVLAEIACGTPPAPRAQTLSDIALLRQANAASWAEVMAIIEREKLYGLGCSFINIALLASACITPDAKLWTLDTRLAKLAQRFGVLFERPLH